MWAAECATRCKGATQQRHLVISQIPEYSQPPKPIDRITANKQRDDSRLSPPRRLPAFEPRHATPRHCSPKFKYHGIIFWSTFSLNFVVLFSNYADY